MCGGRERDDSHGGPVVLSEDGVGIGNKHDGKHGEGADEHGKFSAGVDGMSVLHAEAGEPSASDRPYAGAGVDGDDGRGALLHGEPVGLVEELGEIEEVEPPDGVGEHLGDAEGVKAFMSHQNAVERAPLRHRNEICLGLGGGSAKLVVGEEHPDNKPTKPHGSGGDKGRMPAVLIGDKGNERRGDEGGGVGSGVEETGSQGALIRGEPFGGGFDRGGEVAGFSDAQHEACDTEPRDGEDEGVAHRGERPDADGEGIAQLCAELVDEAPGGEQAYAISDLETDDDVSEVVVEDGLMSVVAGEVPSHEGKVVKRRFDEREDRAVHVVDGGSEEEETADQPADVGLLS